MMPLTNVRGETIYIRGDLVTEVRSGDYGRTEVWLGPNRLITTDATISAIIDRIAEDTK